MISEERKKKLFNALKGYGAYGEIQNTMSRAVFAFTYHQADVLKGYFDLMNEGAEIIYPDKKAAAGSNQVSALIDDVAGAPLRAGEMDEAYLCTPVIQISDDACSAKGSWWVMNAIAEPQRDGDPKAYWAFGKLDAEFANVNQDWKLVKVKYQRITRCDYDLGWVKDSTYEGLYNKNAVRVNITDSTI